MKKDFKCKKCDHEWDWRKQNEIYLCPQCGKAQTKTELERGTQNERDNKECNHKS